MDKNNLIGIIALIAVCISLLLAVFLLTVKSKNRLGNTLLAGFIILNAIDLSGWFTGGFLSSHLNLYIFRNSLFYLINPLFYLYALAICFSDFKLKPKHLLHTIPFLAYNAAMLPGFYWVDEQAKQSFLESFSQNSFPLYENILSHLLFIFYITGIFLTLHKYRKIYLENYADSTTITYQWLFQLTVVDTLVHSIVMVKDFLGFTQQTDIFNGAQIIVGINAVFILCWFVLKALYNPDLFRGVDSRIQPVVNWVSERAADTVSEPPARSAKTREIQNLRDFMQAHEPFLDSTLTVQRLANQMKVPARDLSILINHHLDQHFFDFVNEYRIQKAMKILKDPAQKEMTVLEILYEVGFNSKSSFNTAFKKYTDLTPTQYKNT